MQLLRSQLPHEGLDVDLLLGADCSPELYCHQNFHIYIALSSTLLDEPTHEMDRYHWSILCLCEMHWKNFGETSSDDRHKVYFSEEDDRHGCGNDDNSLKRLHLHMYFKEMAPTEKS